MRKIQSPCLMMLSRTLLSALILFSVSVQAQGKVDFANHAFFKHLIGEWRAEGELKSVDGNGVKLKEEWKGSVSGDNSFLMEGKRELNGDTQLFRWVFIQNPATGFYEASQSTGANGGDSLRFEVVVSEADLTLQLSAPLGDGGSSVTVQHFFPNKDKKDMDTLESKVTLIGDIGTTTLSGTIKHQRVKAP